ncbi:hypothetical protein QYE76_045969 [Lolium multiflorum]|uniref:Subtilisin-like protease fibronectin type-III domain-containing protein n=1 Tax=Lolium multiflorum TaxID=4521 RepID=A0AAD8TP31_LOLMU|nr:hypothetical protein QYE76_045968 [Lolium multiflorum]KAK1685121.1 hypothetical protein QYE76_045969 [Lolium multiflorum]
MAMAGEKKLLYTYILVVGPRVGHEVSAIQHRVRDVHVVPARERHRGRPEWSPAAIKSALMTTAYNQDSAGGVIGDMSTGKASTPFGRGAGHMDPNRAVDPGLVYDAGAEDYITFLCALGYTDDQVITQRRVVRNVGGNAEPTYNATVTSPAGVRVTVKPRKLRFSVTEDTQEYEITFTRAAGSIKEAYTFGSIVWSDGEHTMTSPIAITWPSTSKIAEI